MPARGWVRPHPDVMEHPMKKTAALSLLTAIAAMPLASCAPGQPLAALNPMMMGMDPTPEAAPGYVAMAASSDLYEISSSRMALQRARDPRHRQFAQMMIRDHTNTTARLASAARSLGLVPPPTMLPLHAQMINQLAASRNFDATYHQQQLTATADFDATYRRLQIAVHEEALRLHSNYAQRGASPTMRPVAANAVPIIRRHLRLLRLM